MARAPRKYDHDYKVQAVKLAREIGGTKAARELGIPAGTIHTWMKAARTGALDIGEGAHTPDTAMTMAEELTILRKRVKDQDKIIRRLKEENGIGAIILPQESYGSFFYIKCATSFYNRRLYK